MKKFLPLIFVLVLLFPQITHASWWNPFTWFVSKSDPKTEVLEKRIKELESKINNTPTTTVLNSVKTSTTTNRIITPTESKNTKIKIVPVVDSASKQQESLESELQQEIFRAKQRIEEQIRIDNLKKESLKVQLATTTSNIQTGSISSKKTASIINLGSSVVGTNIIQQIGILGQNDTQSIRSLKIHLITKNTYPSTAYLYRGDSTGISKASMDRDTITFTIPDGTMSASFMADIPTKFTIVINVAEKINYDYELSLYINPADILLLDSSGNEVEVTGSIENTFKVPGTLTPQLQPNQPKCSSVTCGA